MSLGRARVIPRIFLTPGEPAGIGPDLAVVIAQRRLPAQVVAVADPVLLSERARQLRKPLDLSPFDPDAPATRHRSGHLWITPARLGAAAKAGALNPANAEYVLETLRIAARACLRRAGQALVTGPVHKGVINDAGIQFSGHTEFLAELTGDATPVMMLATNASANAKSSAMRKPMRVALATTHLALRDVPAALTRSRLKEVIRVLAADLRARFGISDPRIVVSGLNPHAGEGGHLGREEIEIIEPVLRLLRGEGLNLTGPIPADTLFTPKYLSKADAVLAMYHDQGLPVLKYQGFGKAVNITLGLSIIRTSVDHGTALDLAGTGKADSGSLVAAIEMATELVKRTL